MYHFLDFEKPISILEGRIEELKHLSSGDGINIGLEVSKLEEQLENELKKTYSKLTPREKVKVARHPLMPHPSDINKKLFDNDASSLNNQTLLVSNLLALLLICL
mgnify:CR=1 FL=1